MRILSWLVLLGCLTAVGAEGQTRIDLGQLRQDQDMVALSFTATATSGNLGLFFTCSNPTSTVDSKGATRDAIVYLDCTDQILKVRHKSGSVVVIEQQVAVPKFADQETPAGAIDGSNAAFTLKNAPNPATSLLLFLNGTCMKAGVDYDLSSSAVTFRPAQIPKPGAVLLASYRY